MEESKEICEGEITGIKFSLATHEDFSTSSINECPINHASQLANPFLGLPLEMGKCESCGASEFQQCEGHFGFIELPVPIYHPCHVVGLRQMLSLLCLKCLKFKGRQLSTKNSGGLDQLFACCEETFHIAVKDRKTADGARFIELKVPSKLNFSNGIWKFLERYGYSYGAGHSRTLLPSEVLAILEELPDQTKKKLAKKGHFPQEGYILRSLPVPPNCLSVLDISDGVSVVSDVASTMLKKVLKQIEIIKSTGSVEQSFESDEVVTNELQVAVSQYFQVRGVGAAPNEVGKPYGAIKEASKIAPKAWLEKMKTLFISKGSGSSSRSVITGDMYKRVNEIGLPSEIAQRITLDEKVNVHNIKFLQSLVDKKLCLSFRDDVSAYSLKEGSKGHTLLKPGQVVHRRIMDGDVVFINRPPTTHKHSLQALRVYIHEDHTVKINPLMCGPLGADFDGDCVHVFYPQSLAAKAEVLELFSVEKQLLSSHTGNLNLQLSTDALLSLKKMFKENFFNKLSAQHLSMFARHPLPPPALQKECASVPSWTALEILQTTFPAQFHCRGDQHLIQRNDILKADFNRDVMQSTLDEIIASIVFEKGPNEVLHFFDSLLPLLMENLYSEGHSVSLEDFIIPLELLEDIQEQMQDVSALMFQLKASYNELVEQQIESDLRHIKRPVVTFTLTSSALGSLIDSKSESAINKIVQQIGFLGIQLYDRGKFYSKTLVDDMAHLFHQKYPYRNEFPCEEFGLVKSAFFQGLDPYEELVHSIASREVIIRSSRGLTEPGTLFKNLMAILRDVAICYDGTVRTVSSNSIIQFEYGVHGEKSEILFPPGEPVGVLAATAMSNPAYKAVLDSSPSSNSSWDTMKEILFSNVKFKNDVTDRRVILYLNSCKCGRKFCRENASCTLKNLLKKVSLKDAAEEFLIEYKKPSVTSESDELGNGLVGHIHLSKDFFYKSNISMRDILDKCEDEVNPFRKKKKFTLFRRILLSVSECCPFSHRSECSGSGIPCLKFFWKASGESGDAHLDKASRFMADVICPVLLGTIIKGDPRISAVNIIWINPDTSTWIGNSNDCQIGELAVEVVVDSKAVKRSGDAYRVALDCCLPVLHLIDTRRMIPHSVKQIQQVLGISCAFDQAVQRLSTSVKMVAKSVLKEHLILLGSSMTSTGDLIGFNSGGIKAMYSTSGVQAPFTEATLHTPKKCFEGAAEKCRLDSLSSVVGSCCWGKPVAVGTGAKVDILWNEKEAPLEKESIDVYDFLQLVRSPQGEEDGDNGCLGDDVDTCEKEDENMIECLSPKDSKAVFEDDEVKVLTYDDWRSCGVKKQATKDSTALAQNSQSHGPRFEYGWESKRRNPETSSVRELPLKARSQGWSYPNEDSNDKYTPIEVVYEGPPGLNMNQREDLLGWFSPDELRPSSRGRGRGSGRGRGTGRGVETTPCGRGRGGRGRGRGSGRGRGAQSSWGPGEASGRGRGRGSGRGRGRDRGRGAQSSWGQAETSGWMKKGSDFVRGFSFNARGTRNNNRNQPPRAHGPVYTPEEQNILSEVEPIMKSVRRIMHQEGYTDGQPISIEDQRFIVQNVLMYHPDRDAKRGCGIDHIMVSKHSRYQDTRCLYVVSTDGQRRDFSYKKCIDNMIRNKHPYLAQSFISKYWKN